MVPGRYPAALACSRTLDSSRAHRRRLNPRGPDRQAPQGPVSACAGCAAGGASTRGRRTPARRTARRRRAGLGATRPRIVSGPQRRRRGGAGGGGGGDRDVKRKKLLNNQQSTANCHRSPRARDHHQSSSDIKMRCRARAIIRFDASERAAANFIGHRRDPSCIQECRVPWYSRIKSIHEIVNLQYAPRDRHTNFTT
eukprot:SAG31_NODE_5_length_43735_cov_42.922266_34_plen_197_part_00